MIWLAIFLPASTAADRELIENLQQQLKRPWPELQAAIYGAKFATLRAPKDTDEEIKEIFKRKGRR